MFRHTRTGDGPSDRVDIRLPLGRGFWNDRTDFDQDAVFEDGRRHSETEDVPRAERAAPPSLWVRLLPILVPLALIAFLMVRSSLGPDDLGKVLGAGFHTTGGILLVTGVGGSLGAAIAASGPDKPLEELFPVDESAPVMISILLAWLIAAVLHFAIGSVSVGAVTAAGIISPIVGSLGVDPVVIALAIACGAMFALHVNSNCFWMFRTLLDLSTKGSLKTLTLATSLGAVVSLPLVLVASLVAAVA